MRNARQVFHITDVRIFNDGTVETSNADGVLMPDYCGPFDQVVLRIIADAPPTTQFWMIPWRSQRGNAMKPISRWEFWQHCASSEQSSIGRRRKWWGAFSERQEQRARKAMATVQLEQQQAVSA